jgi:hypothetical protein
MSLMTSTISEASDLELIRHMKLRLSDSALAEEAFEEFYRRYSTRFLKAAHKHTFYLGSRFDPESHVIETFIQIYEQAEKFDGFAAKHGHKFTAGGSTSEPKQDIIEFWIFQVFGTKLDEYRAERSEKNNLFNRAYKSSEPKWGLSGVGLNYGRMAFTDFSPTLKPEDREILLVSYRFYDEFSGMCKIPDKTRSELCAKLKITPENLRKRRQRLVKELVTFARSKMNSQVLRSFSAL